MFYIKEIEQVSRNTTKTVFAVYTDSCPESAIQIFERSPKATVQKIVDYWNAKNVKTDQNTFGY